MFNAGPKIFDEGFPVLPKRGYFEKGDSGKQVEKTQKYLVWMDLYSDEIDGIYGEKTVDAVKDLSAAQKEKLVRILEILKE